VCFTWRTRLSASSEYWSSWFEGLNELFLSVVCPKLLLLSCIDRLDGPMSIAQMQGKLQVKVIQGVGHQIMEDQPKQTADIIKEFVQRQQMFNRAIQINKLKSNTYNISS